MHKRAALALGPICIRGEAALAGGPAQASAPIPYGYYPDSRVLPCPTPEALSLALLKGVTVMGNGALVPIMACGGCAYHPPSELACQNLVFYCSARLQTKERTGVW